MKKLLLLSVAILMGIFVFAQNKTQDHPTCERVDNAKGTKAVWAEIGGNFTSTDINSVEHDLNTYLAAGKTVILDFSAIWCAPCWSLHGSGVLDDLHNTYGPDGTDELVVLWIECDGGTLDEINGIGSSTQGDWTVGGTWPVPIIQGSSELSLFSELYEGYVPTVFMACPSGYYKDVTDQCWTSAAAVYAEIGTCPVTGAVPEATIEGPVSGFVGNALDFSAIGVSVDPISGYAWTFASGTPATSDQENVSVTWDAVGEYEVTLVISNANGDSQPATVNVNIMDGTADDKNVTFEEVIVGTTFATNFAPYNWTTVDEDGGTVWGDFSDWGVTGDANAFSVYGHTLAASDYAPFAGDKCGFAMTNNPGAGNGTTNDDWLISPQFDLGTGSTFTLQVAGTNTTWGNEKYQLGVSTTDAMPASFTIIGGQRTVGAGWAEVTLDLAAYDGQSVFIAVNYVGTDTYAFMVDNMVLTTVVDVNTEVTPNISVYPNPASDIINVKYAENANITVINMLGEVVRTIENASANQTIDMSDLSNGTYFVRVNQEVFKINLAK